MTSTSRPRIQPLSTRIPEPLYAWMTAWCDRERQTIQEVVTEALLLFQEKQDPASKARTMAAINPPPPPSLSESRLATLEEKVAAQDSKLDAILDAIRKEPARKRA